MKVTSTRGGASVSLSDAILQGLAPDGGLYMPPLLSDRPTIGGATLIDRAHATLAPFFARDRLEPHLPAMLNEAFTFDAPTHWLSDDTGLLELFHGPTAAFKDFGARFLAAAMQRLVASDSMTTVLVATSGDTGAAVASAFHKRAGFRVVILYPDARVSPRQAHQLGAFGDNVRALRVAGTFDDCQRIVKSAFTDPALTSRHRLASANSISLGRLLPQMAYYAHASLTCVADGRGSPSFVVPTGNLGNAFACLLAREAGLPIDRIVLASNANRSVANLIATGRYEPSSTIATLANAMDVGAPSNVERLIHRFCDLRSVVDADWVADDAVRAAIARTFFASGVAICPHTACGVEVLQRMRDRGEARAGEPWIVAATAHPAKFETIVEPLTGESVAPPPELARLLARPSHAEAISPTLAALADQLDRAHTVIRDPSANRMSHE